MPRAGSGSRELLAIALLAVLPAIAHAPAWWEQRLLGPGDGAILHYPLRAAVWQAYLHGDIPSWNPDIFSGTPLLAAYRPGGFYPPAVALTPLPPFVAFQVLVLSSLAGAGVLAFLCARRLGAGVVGAYVAGLSFALGPYLVGHMGDTATLVAAPLLPGVLLAAEVHLYRGTRASAAWLAAALALLLLAGSPEAARAGLALAVGRIALGHGSARAARRASFRASGLALLCGGLLAAPQLLPALLALHDAGHSVTGLAEAEGDALPGMTGLVLRYVSHTPAPSLALAALPLVVSEAPVRFLGAALLACLGLQWGRGPLAAPGSLALVFDLALALLAGLSLSVQWEQRRKTTGRRLRMYFLVAALASTAALSVSTAILGPLPETLMGAVGVLALSLVLYFSLASSPHPVRAGVWLLPLTVSFLLQPQGRGIWSEAPTRRTLELGTLSSAAIERAMGGRRGERVLTLVRAWPERELADLAFGNLGMLHGRRSASGYDPMVPLRSRAALDGIGSGGLLPGSFFRTDPARLEELAVRWVQVPASALITAPDRWGLGDTLDIRIEGGQSRFIPLPLVSATEIRLASSLSEAVAVRQGQPVARVAVRLATGREVELYLRAGLETAEWAYDRPDVRPFVAHDRPPLFETFPGPDRTFAGHRYHCSLRLPGRFFLDGVRIEAEPGAGLLTLARMSLLDASEGRFYPVSLAAGYVSDASRFREAAVTPFVRLFELPRSPGPARVVERLRLLPDDAAVLRALRSPGASGIEPARECLAVAADAAGVVLPEGARSSRAVLQRAKSDRLDVRAEGPGLLVVAEGWDAGWSATLDGRDTRLLRVNHAEMGVVVPGGVHRIEFSYRSRGLSAGLGLAAAALLALIFVPI